MQRRLGCKDSSIDLPSSSEDGLMVSAREMILNLPVVGLSGMDIGSISPNKNLKRVVIILNGQISSQNDIYHFEIGEIR